MENLEGSSWVETEVVPKITAVLAKDGGDVQYQIKTPTDTHFISSVFMVDLIFRSEAGKEIERMGLVVKVPPKDQSTCVCMRCDVLFHNEIVFYRRFGCNYSGYPRSVLLVAEPRPVIVIENVTHFGYKSVLSTEELDMKRVLTAVREIGRFHARGYVLKEKDPAGFFGVVEELRETHDDSTDPAMIEWVNRVSMRPINYLRSVDYDPSFCKAMSKFFGNAHKEILQDCVEPRNELAVLCHGDLTSNNVLFKPEADGEFEAMLIDFAQFRYASPATDMSSFLYLSCNDETRKNFPVIFRAYHDVIMEHLAEQDIRDLERYSFAAFLKDYKRHAIIGCGLASFFVPVHFLGYRLSFDEIMRNTSRHVANAMVCGGDALSKRLADMLLELRGNGCLDHMI